MKKSFFLLAYSCVRDLFGQGIETFSNVSLTATYSDGDFDRNNGIEWNYVPCRKVTSATVTTSSLEKISLPAILLKGESTGSTVYAMSGINGVGQVRMKLYKACTPSTLRQMDLYLNNILVGTSPGFNDDYEHNYLVSDINELGNVKIEIKKAKSVQIIIDDIEWSATNQVLSINNKSIEDFIIYRNPLNSHSFRIVSLSRA